MGTAIAEPADVSRALSIPFSAEQLDAITAPLEPGSIVAGAGTGKTTVMAARVVWLIGTGQVLPEQVLGLTFTRKAAGELAARIAAALESAGLAPSGESGEQTVSTYDAFVGTVLAEFGSLGGVPQDRRLITAAEASLLAAESVRSADVSVDALQVSPSTVAARVRSLDAALAAHLVALDDVRAADDALLQALAEAPLNRGRPFAPVADAQAAVAKRRELMGFVTAYRALKAERGLLEFADQLAAVAHLVAGHPGIGTALRERYRVVLLDEYQDTSAAQVQVLRALFSGAVDPAGAGFPVTAVGDPLQAIYGWRGAAAANVLAFGTDFPLADGTPAPRRRLTQNRRSAPGVLDVANAVSQDLRARDIGNELLAPTQPPPRAAVVTVGRFLTRTEEFAWIGDRIVALHESGADAGGVERWADIAVLTRTNEAAGQLFAYLDERDIPVEIVGLGGLLDVPEVADVVATLQVLNDATANGALVRLLTGPRWRLADADLEALGKRAEELAPEYETDGGRSERDAPSLQAALSSPGERMSPAGARRCRRLAAELSALRDDAGAPVVDLVRRCINALGLDVELQLTDALLERGGRRQLAAFLDAVAEFVAAGGGSLPDLLSYLDAAREEENGLEQAKLTGADAVKLLTVHKSKGLEWEAVFLPGVVEGGFPAKDHGGVNWLKAGEVVPAPLRGDRAWIPQLAEPVTKDSIEAYADALRADGRDAEDRLGYVAVSRAKRVLALTMAAWVPDRARPKAPSPYLLAAEPFATERFGADLDPGETNPSADPSRPVAWPQPDPERLSAKRTVAAAVTAARGALLHPPVPDGLSWEDRERVARWSAESDRLIAEVRAARAPVRDVRLPSSLTASQAMWAHADPAAFASELLRPMPQPPALEADTGTRFHAWVEQRFGNTMLPGLGTALDEWDADGSRPGDEAEFRALCEAFEEGQFADRAPAAVEQTFVLDLGRQVRGRIDAVYADGDGWLVVDWKTGRGRSDPLQLAIYRLAWAHLRGVAPEQVRAAFYHVRDDRLEPLTDPPDLPTLAAVVSGIGTNPAGGAE